ncbi:MAG TPA: sigma-70 family RNA polymerase sigma factor [Solirubrobacterales bacterium]|nr:sigma-70 family RNA polymerase sigma factor [Solirubrobacterales bacterium]
MYGSKVNGELSQSQLQAARLGFLKYLRRKRFSEEFIENHGDDLFSIATVEYSRKLREGVEIERPGGWLIDCAWKRTKSFLEAEHRRPGLVSVEKAEEVLPDEETPTPEMTALEEDRIRKVHEAVAQLSEDQQRFLAYAYFEEKGVRDLARQLGWHPSRAQRFHEAARKQLKDLLGVESIDDLVIEIGLAAYVSIAVERSSGRQLPAGLEGAMDMVERTATDLWARAQDLARRLPLGGNAEPSATAVLGGTAGRAAGVCATAAAACLAATGVVGPGLGFLDRRGEPAGKSPVKRERVAKAPAATPLIPKLRPAAPADREPEPQPRGERDERRSTAGAAATTSAERRQRKANKAVRSALPESIPDASAEEEAAPFESLPTEPSTTETSESSSTASTSSSTADQVAAGQFSPSP